MFQYRGMSYRVEIEGCPAGYAGVGTLRGLDWRAAVAGDYIAQPGNAVWNNPNGVVIEVNPPIQSIGNRGNLRFYFSGASLPRQS